MSQSCRPVALRHVGPVLCFMAKLYTAECCIRRCRYDSLRVPGTRRSTHTVGRPSIRDERECFFFSSIPFRSQLSILVSASRFSQVLLSFSSQSHFYHASICEGGLGSRNSVRPPVRPSVCPSVCLSHAWIVTNLNGALQIF